MDEAERAIAGSARGFKERMQQHESSCTKRIATAVKYNYVQTVYCTRVVDDGEAALVGRYLCDKLGRSGYAVSYNHEPREVTINWVHKLKNSFSNTYTGNSPFLARMYGGT